MHKSPFNGYISELCETYNPVKRPSPQSEYTGTDPAECQDKPRKRRKVEKNKKESKNSLYSSVSTMVDSLPSLERQKTVETAV